MKHIFTGQRLDFNYAMWCEYGLDYGKTQNWDDTTLKILEIFNDGYCKNEEDLTKLITIIEGGIKN